MEISEVADQVAGRLAADGRLLLASARPDFTSEGFIRSGGLMLAEEWTPETRLSPDDVVILGWSGCPAGPGVGVVAGTARLGCSDRRHWAGLVGWGGFAGGGRPIPRERNSPARGGDRSLRRRGLPADFPAKLSCLVDLYRRDRGRLGPGAGGCLSCIRVCWWQGRGIAMPGLSARGSTRHTKCRRFLWDRWVGDYLGRNRRDSAYSDRGGDGGD